MKFALYVLVFFSMNPLLKASEYNSKNSAPKNPMIMRADTLTGQIEHSKAQALLLETAARKTSTDSKIKMQVETQKSYQRIRQLSMQDDYNQAILDSHANLNCIADRNILSNIALRLHGVLDSNRPQDKVLVDRLQGMRKNLETKYCFKKPSARRVERERAALFELVNQRMIQINKENEIADDTSSRSSSPDMNPSAPVYAVAVDNKTAHYRGYM